MKNAFFVFVLALLMTFLSISKALSCECDLTVLKEPPPWPSEGVLEQLVENPPLFAERIFEYNSLIQKYDFALNCSGNPHSIYIPPIDYTKIEEPDEEELRKFFNAADSLYKKVLQIENRTVNQSPKFKSKDLDQFRKTYEETVDDWRQIVNLGLFAQIFQFHDDFVTTNLSPGIKVELSPWKIFGLWFDYSQPNFNYQSFYYKNNEKIYSPSSYDFKVNLFNVGFQIFDNDIVKLPFMDNVSLGVKLGYGYYWANWQMYNNATAEKTNADYHNIRGEINLSKHDLFIPLEFFFAYNFYFGADKIQLNLGNNDNHVLTSNSFGAFSLGLRFNIWRTP